MDGLIKITIEGSTFSAEKGTTVTHFIPRLKLDQKPLFAKINALVVGLDTPMERDMEIQLIYTDSDEVLDILRHSAAHLLAHTVLELFPGTQTGIGPAVEEGFFYDFL